MKTVRINKIKLLQKLRDNRKDHREIFIDALNGWKNRVVESLEKAVEEAKDGLKYKTHFHLPIPEDHTLEYDDIIERVEWHESEFIELDIRDFTRFVRDRWDWMPDFIGLATAYSSSSSSSKSPSASTLSRKIDEIRGLKSGVYVEDDWEDQHG